MKKIAGIACSTVMLVALAGCGPGDGTEPATSAGSPAVEAGNNPTQATQMEGKLPRGMQLNFQHHLVRDGRLHGDSGESQRLVRVEYLDMDREEVIKAIDDNFTSSSYEAASRRELDSGDIQLRYEHERADLAAIVTVREGGELEHADAGGLVVLTFPPKSEPHPEDGM